MDIKRKNEGDDPLVDGIVKAREWFAKNATHLAVGCAAVIIIAAGTLIYNNMKESSIRSAQELFGVGVLDYNAGRFDEALRSFGEAANNHRNTPIGAMSAFMMGSIYLEQDNADQAVTWFETALSGGEAGFVKGQAHEGIAAAFEKKGDNSAAIRHLERALRDRSAAHRHAAVRWKLALLNKNGNTGAASAYCKELIADTLAVAYHQKAENLLASLAK